MDAVIAFLQGLFDRTLFKVTPQHVKTVATLADAQIPAFLKSGQLPALILTPLGEDASRPGPFSRTSTRPFRVRVRIVTNSTSPLVPWQEGNPSGIAAISDAVRAAVATDKQLGLAQDPDAPYAYSLELDQPATDGAMVSPSLGALVARDVILTYTRFEEWTGTRNPQESLKLPQLATAFAL